MAYERKPGDIAIFAQHDKKNEKAPDIKGTGLDLDGREIEIALWKKTGSKGGTFYAGKIQYPREKSAPSEPSKPKTVEAMDDDIPF